MKRLLSPLLFALIACASPETQRDLGRHADASAPSEAPTAPSDGAAVAPSAPVHPVLATPGPETPPVLDTLVPFFGEPPLSDAVTALDGDETQRAIESFEAFALAHPEDPRALGARLQAAWLLADKAPQAAAERFLALSLDWPLMSDIAAVRAAELQAVSAPEAALATLDKVPADSVHAGRALLLRSRLLAAQPDGKKRAREVLEEAAARDPGRLLPESWQSLADLRAPDRTAAAALYELAVRFPTDPLGKDALKALAIDKLSGPERVRLGRALFDAWRFDAMRGVLGTLRAPKASACEAWILLGRAAEKKKKEDAQALDKAFAYYEKALACEGEPRADATFLGGRARLATQPKVAKKLLSAHAKEFPKRSTADDALLLLAESETRPKKATKALLATLRSYPQGDMADAVAWDLVGPSVEARRWQEVLATTEQVLAIAPGDVSGRHPGRFRYWHARALWELGKKDEARAEWRRVFSDNPLSWYAVLAYSRLADASGLVPETTAVTGPPDLRVPAALWQDVHFRRAVEWARLGGASAEKPSPFLDLIDLELAAVPPAARPQGDEWTWTRIEVQQLGGGFPRSMKLARTLEAQQELPFPVGLDAYFWKLAYPRPFLGYVTRWATERALDPNWIWAVMRVESNFDPQAVSWANAIGLMQIILPTAKTLARDTEVEPTRENLMRPEVALELGTKYLQRLLDRHKVVPLASAGYNAGGGAVSKWRKQFGDVDIDEFVERIPYREAQLYAKSVTQTLARYLWLYQGQLLALDLKPVGAPDVSAAPTE